MCRAVDAGRKPIVGLRIEVFDQDPKSPHDPLGEPAITDDDGMVTFRYKHSDFTEHPGEQGPDLYFKVHRGEVMLEYVLQGINNDKGVIRKFQPQREPIILRVDKHHVVTGVIMQTNGLPAEKLKLFVHHLAFGGEALLLGSPTTDVRGRYVLAYNPGVGAVNLEIRVRDPQDKEKMIPLMKPRFAVAGFEVLNLVAPSAPLAAEYRRLVADLTPHVGQISKLADARENDERQDLTVLNRATGWDARLIALAAVSERLSADAEVKLPQEAVYGLMRAGLPSDKLLLAQVEPDVIELALKTVRDAGIVNFTDQEIDESKATFGAFAARERLNIPAPGTLSTYGQLLNASTAFPDSDKGQKARELFADLYFNYQGDAARFWKKAAKAGLEDGQIRKLQLQGKLSFLAGNSVEMTKRLMNKKIDEKPINDPAQLVEKDFHRSEAWLKEVFEQAEISLDRRGKLTDADKEKLDQLIPTAYVADNVEERLRAYTEDMSRKVRLSYPTQVVTRLIETDDKFKSLAYPDTVKLLKKATGQGFRLGTTPVTAFLKTHDGVTAGMAAPAVQSAQKQLQTIQRVYQITPDNEAMPVMISLGMTSAYDVMAYTEVDFAAHFNAKYLEIYKKPAAAGLAGLIYRKAKQVSSVTYNLFTIAKKLDNEPPVAGLSASVEVRESVRNELIKQFPTMESLFGSMDFCECEHCRSVLSPAAYLVDLLQFVDPEPGVWGNFLALWKATHNNQEYTVKYKKPYDALIERRPDLPYIPLTCENTNTALPYIDIVNEILEYYVAHGQLEEKAAHDTGEATTEELLAEPQNVIRQAYDKLREASYPLNLPFDLWIETVRRFCNYFEMPLAQVLEVFRRSDELFVPAQPFDRSDIFMESLGFSPAEVSLFTNPDPLSSWHRLYGFNTAAQATTEAIDASTGQRIDLNSAKALARRLGVTYKEIAEIVQTGFINPKLTRLHLLYKLGVSINDARFYLEHKNDPAPVSVEEQKRQLEVQAFAQKLAELAETFQVTTAQLEAKLQDIPFDKILVLADTDTGCNFDLTTLRYADGRKAAPIAFLRINLFVRLWRKLGWSIEETDRALSVFIPQSAPFDDNPANLAKQPLKTALVYLAHLKALDEKVKTGKQSRLKLITLWSDIDTTGKNPLYAQLFLTRSVLKSDPVFDHPLGLYLTDATVKLQDHVLAVQGALGLTADEIGSILADAGKSLDATELTLPNVSLLYRYGLLAKALKLSVRELIAIKQFSGLDPFKPLHPDPLATIEDDYPFSQTLRFVQTVEEVKDSGLKIEDLDYLLRHRFDETGKYRPNRDGMLALIKTLAEGIRAIRTEHAVPDDPGEISEEMLRQKLGLALPPGVVETFLAMMNGRAEFSAAKSGVEPENRLDPKTFEDEERILSLSYKEVPHKEQKLTLRGVLFADQKTELETKFNAVLSEPQISAFAELLGNVQKQARDFFDNQLKKQKLRLEGEAGFLEDSDFKELFYPLKLSKKILPTDTPQEVNAKLQENEEIEQENQATLQQRRCRIAGAFLPSLQQRLIRQFIVRTMTAYTGADPVLVESLITDERLLAVAATKPLLASFEPIGKRGVSAEYFDSNDLSGTAQAAKAVVSSADTSLKDTHDTYGNPLNTANSARFEGYLEVPTPGAYRFYIELDKQNAEAELQFAHLSNPVFLTGSAGADNATLGEQPEEFLELKPGIPYCFSLELKKLGGGGARLLVQGETLPKDGISQLTLYPLSAMVGAEQAILLLTKALQLVQGLSLSERETRYLLTHASDFGNVNLSQLPTRAVGDTPTEKVATTERFKQFLRLASYARLKRDLAATTDDLIDIFEANGTGDPGNVYPLIAKLTHRDEATVKDTAEAMFAAPGFESEKPLVQLWQTLQLVERFGAPVASLLKWTRIAGAGVTPGQRFAIAREFKEALKARCEPETWQRVARSIFDKLRQRQRDALVSYVIHQHGFDRMEQLYEYFLIDPGMEPVVQTSRIRLAISSVQLFIQRCLLNLEPKVHPSTLNSKHWEWMKRYRVWEANRKIFLFPENWLEPEFRDDKTYLFAELEGALLQDDVSSDLADDAFLNYLKKLDELARLDIVAMHIEDNADPTRRTLHVFGRTYSRPHKHFYRRYAHQMWTPWEPVSAEIEGDHLAPVVWRDRLYLFWVTFLDKPVENSQPSGAGADTTLDQLKLKDAVTEMQTIAADKTIEIKLHWSEYLQGEWSTSESGEFVPVTQGDTAVTVPMKFKPSQALIHVSKAIDEAGEELGVHIHLGAPLNQSFYLAGRNSKPERKNYNENGSRGALPENLYSSANNPCANRYSGNGELMIEFQELITTEPGKTPPKENREILAADNRPQGGAYTLLPCDNNLTALGVSEEAYQGAANPNAVKEAIERGLGEIASLIKPVFYQDNLHTLFVEPNVTETTIEEWQEWVARKPRPEPGWKKPGWWKDIVVIPDKPWQRPFSDPRDPLLAYGRESLINPAPERDWLLNPGTVLEFDNVLIGPAGQPGLKIITEEVNKVTAEGGTIVNANPGGSLASGGAVVLADATAHKQSGLMQAAGGLNIVGSAGFNSALEKNFNELNRAGFGAGMSTTGTVRR